MCVKHIRNKARNHKLNAQTVICISQISKQFCKRTIRLMYVLYKLCTKYQ